MCVCVVIFFSKVRRGTDGGSLKKKVYGGEETSRGPERKVDLCIAFPQTVCRVCVEKSKVSLLFKWVGVTFRSLRYMVGGNACLTLDQQPARYSIEHTRSCIVQKVKCILCRKKGQKTNFLL